MKTSLLASALLSLIVVSASFGQITAPAAQACNPRFARTLVESQVMESNNAVVDPVKRIKILLRSADFLWTPDEPTARKYFADAVKLANDRFADAGFETKKTDPKDDRYSRILPD